MGELPKNLSPRIANRRALHDYEIVSKLECGIALTGSEVKSLRLGMAQLSESFATIERGDLVLHKCQIDPYRLASIAYNHEPKRDRRLLAHRREINKIEGELKKGGMTLIPLAIYFKGGRVKVEIGLARGRRQHDKREAIRQKEQKRELRNMTLKRR